MVSHKLSPLAAAAILAYTGSVSAAVALYGQCGGINYTGETTCVAGAQCQYYHDWYSQCIPATSSASSSSTSKASSSVTSTSTTSSASATATGLRHLHKLASAKGRYFGTAVDAIWSNTDTTYKAITGDVTEFGVFYTTIGADYIPIALKAARVVDPSAKLYLNDYNTDGVGNKSNAYYTLAQSLIAAGVPLDGIGFQGHLIVGSVPTTIPANLKRFTDLKLEVAFTELDIRMTLPATDALLAQQAKDYVTVVNACLGNSLCVGVQTWDTSEFLSLYVQKDGDTDMLQLRR
ncbi:hypothetical protein FRC03_003251 [Tulasnella sp. 419]|nr:hypothetical protein FRC03_003251 [Tulasnella sp. 419]